jgi:hypothetical protein
MENGDIATNSPLAGLFSASLFLCSKPWVVSGAGDLQSLDPGHPSSRDGEDLKGGSRAPKKKSRRGFEPLRDSRLDTRRLC